MAGKKISALNPLTPLDGTKEAVIEISGTELPGDDAGHCRSGRWRWRRHDHHRR